MAGAHGGLLWRLDLGVAAADGRVLDHYGHGVLALVNSAAGLWAVDYDPGRGPPPGSYLAASHICGSAHSLQLAHPRG